MPEDKGGLFGRIFGKRAPESVPFSLGSAPLPLLDNRRDGILAAISGVETSIVQRGINLPPPGRFERGYTTNDQDLFKLFQLRNQLEGRQIASVHIPASSFSYMEAYRSIYNQITGEAADQSLESGAIRDLIRQRNFALAITVDAGLTMEVVEGNRDINAFQNAVRGMEQGSPRVPVCAYSENERVIPTEIAISLPFFGVRKKPNVR